MTRLRRTRTLKDRTVLSRLLPIRQTTDNLFSEFPGRIRTEDRIDTETIQTLSPDSFFPKIWTDPDRGQNRDRQNPDKRKPDIKSGQQTDNTQAFPKIWTANICLRPNRRCRYWTKISKTGLSSTGRIKSVGSEFQFGPEIPENDYEHFEEMNYFEFWPWIK